MLIYSFIKVFILSYYKSDSYCIDTTFYDDLKKILSKKNSDRQTDKVKLRATLTKVKLANNIS